MANTEILDKDVVELLDEEDDDDKVELHDPDNKAHVMRKRSGRVVDAQVVVHTEEEEDVDIDLDDSTELITVQDVSTGNEFRIGGNVEESMDVRQSDGTQLAPQTTPQPYMNVTGTVGPEMCPVCNDMTQLEPMGNIRCCLPCMAVFRSTTGAPFIGYCETSGRCVLKPDTRDRCLSCFVSRLQAINFQPAQKDGVILPEVSAARVPITVQPELPRQYASMSHTEVAQASSSISSEERCNVCGDDGHLRDLLGFAACVPCITFYNKYISQSSHPACRFGNSCTMNYVSRNMCSPCRYRKICMLAGKKGNRPAVQLQHQEQPQAYLPNNVTPPADDWKKNSPSAQVGRKSARELYCQVCEICCDKLMPFSGVRVCSACSAFLRSYKFSACNNNNECVITPSTRTQCRRCRYEKAVFRGCTYAPFSRDKHGRVISGSIKQHSTLPTATVPTATHPTATVSHTSITEADSTSNGVTPPPPPPPPQVPAPVLMLTHPTPPPAAPPRRAFDEEEEEVDVMGNDSDEDDSLPPPTPPPPYSQIDVKPVLSPQKKLTPQSNAPVVSLDKLQLGVQAGKVVVQGKGKRKRHDDEDYTPCNKQPRATTPRATTPRATTPRTKAAAAQIVECECVVCNGMLDCKELGGAWVCISCYDFLTSQQSKGEELSCPAEGRCIITEISTQRCPGCRYNKAASMGIVKPMPMRVGRAWGAAHSARHSPAPRQATPPVAPSPPLPSPQVGKGRKSTTGGTPSHSPTPPRQRTTRGKGQHTPSAANTGSDCSVCHSMDAVPVTPSHNLCENCQKAMEKQPRHCINKGRCIVNTDTAKFCLLCRYQKASADGIVAALQDLEKGPNGQGRGRRKSADNRGKSEGRDADLDTLPDIPSSGRRKSIEPQEKASTTPSKPAVASKSGRAQCKVCNSPIDVRLVNDVHLCVACKSFVADKAVLRYLVCEGEGNCVITLRTRNQCKACRYNKAASLGACKALPLKMKNTNTVIRPSKSPVKETKVKKEEIPQVRNPSLKPKQDPEPVVTSSTSILSYKSRKPTTIVSALPIEYCSVCAADGLILNSMCSACNQFMKRRTKNPVACFKGQLQCAVTKDTRSQCEGCRYHKAACMGLTTPLLEVRTMEGKIIFDPEVDKIEIKPPAPQARPVITDIRSLRSESTDSTSSSSVATTVKEVNGESSDSTSNSSMAKTVKAVKVESSDSTSSGSVATTVKEVKEVAIAVTPATNATSASASSSSSSKSKTVKQVKGADKAVTAENSTTTATTTTSENSSSSSTPRNEEKDADVDVSQGNSATEGEVSNDGLCCTVCDDKNYVGKEDRVRDIFGVVICRDCEAFINRMSKVTEIVTCVMGLGRCRITVRNRDSCCRFCRYMECIATGLPIKQRENFQLSLGQVPTPSVSPMAALPQTPPNQPPQTPPNPPLQAPNPSPQQLPNPPPQHLPNPPPQRPPAPQRVAPTPPTPEPPTLTREAPFQAEITAPKRSTRRSLSPRVSLTAVRDKSKERKTPSVPAKNNDDDDVMDDLPEYEDDCDDDNDADYDGRTDGYSIAQDDLAGASPKLTRNSARRMSREKTSQSPVSDSDTGAESPVRKKKRGKGSLFTAKKKRDPNATANQAMQLLKKAKLHHITPKKPDATAVPVTTQGKSDSVKREKAEEVPGKSPMALKKLAPIFLKVQTRGSSVESESKAPIGTVESKKFTQLKVPTDTDESDHEPAKRKRGRPSLKSNEKDREAIMSPPSKWGRKPSVDVALTPQVPSKRMTPSPSHSPAHSPARKAVLPSPRRRPPSPGARCSVCDSAKRPARSNTPGMYSCHNCADSVGRHSRNQSEMQCLTGKYKCVMIYDKKRTNCLYCRFHRTMIVRTGKDSGAVTVKQLNKEVELRHKNRQQAQSASEMSESAVETDAESTSTKEEADPPKSSLKVKIKKELLDVTTEQHRSPSSPPLDVRMSSALHKKAKVELARIILSHRHLQQLQAYRNSQSEGMSREEYKKIIRRQGGIEVVVDALEEEEEDVDIEGEESDVDVEGEDDMDVDVGGEEEDLRKANRKCTIVTNKVNQVESDEDEDVDIEDESEDTHYETQQSNDNMHISMTTTEQKDSSSEIDSDKNESKQKVQSDTQKICEAKVDDDDMSTEELMEIDVGNKASESKEKSAWKGESKMESVRKDDNKEKCVSEVESKDKSVRKEESESKKKSVSKEECDIQRESESKIDSYEIEPKNKTENAKALHVSEAEQSEDISVDNEKVESCKDGVRMEVTNEKTADLQESSDIDINSEKESEDAEKCAGKTDTSLVENSDFNDLVASDDLLSPNEDDVSMKSNTAERMSSSDSVGLLSTAIKTDNVASNSSSSTSETSAVKSTLQKSPRSDQNIRSFVESASANKKVSSSTNLDTKFGQEEKGSEEICNSESVSEMEEKVLENSEETRSKDRKLNEVKEGSEEKSVASDGEKVEESKDKSGLKSVDETKLVSNVSGEEGLIENEKTVEESDQKIGAKNVHKENISDEIPSKQNKVGSKDDGENSGKKPESSSCLKDDQNTTNDKSAKEKLPKTPAYSEARWDDSEDALKIREFASDWVDMESDMESGHDDYKCKGCAQPFASGGLTAQHVIQMHCTCEKCNKRFPEVFLLKSHMSDVHKSHNQTSFNSEFKLSASECLRGSGEESMCRLCGERFSFLLEARAHMSRMHVRSPPKYKCHQCNIEFHKEETLDTHLCGGPRGHTMMRGNKENAGEKSGVLLKQGTVMVISGGGEEDEEVDIDDI